jgi:hypothetical protein
MKNLKKIAFYTITILFTITMQAQNKTNRVAGTSVGPTECAKAGVDSEIKTRLLDFVPNNNILYDMRDKFLNLTIRGKRYIDEYYYVSSTKKDYSSLKTSTLLDIISLMPLIEVAYEKVTNVKYSGTIVDDKTSSLLTNVFTDFKSLSVDTKYLSIINNLQIDLKFVTNKDKKTLIDFMNK